MHLFSFIHFGITVFFGIEVYCTGRIGTKVHTFHEVYPHYPQASKANISGYLQTHPDADSSSAFKVLAHVPVT